MFRKNLLFRGFTLIELLVVIAIIGMLASVVLASLNSARLKGSTAAAQQTMKSMQAAAYICLGEGRTINAPTATQDGGAGLICAGAGNTARYVSLPAGWVYSTTVTNTAGVSFSFSAASTGTGTTITCTQNSCVVS